MESGEGAQVNPDNETQKEAPKKRLGCEHYARKCSFISPCCNKVYQCRVCHDDKENHRINRRDVQQVKCLQCQLVQKVQRECEGCSILFGKYFCDVCRLYDDDDKGQFHCIPCGLCRIGGREKFFHCEKCDMCLSVLLENKHQCVVESSRRNCAVCLEDLHTSRISAHIPPCGHLLHGECYKQCMKTGNYSCPTCNQSLVDMEDVWKHLDTEIENTPMPDEYKDFKVYILCRDCHKESKVKFHVVGLKCADCGSYNTTRTADRDETSEPGGTEGTATSPPGEGASGDSSDNNTNPQENN